MNDLLTQEKTIINKFCDQLINSFSKHILAVYLFGSRATNTARFDSDYDFLILVEKRNIDLKNQIYELVYDYLLKYHADISLKIVSTRDWREMKRLETPFYQNVTMDGLLLWKTKRNNSSVNQPGDISVDVDVKQKKIAKIFSGNSTVIKNRIMNKIKTEYILDCIKKSKNKLLSAKNSMDNDFFDDAISRAYYAVFHAAKVLLQYVGIEARSHEGLKQMFGLHFVKPGLISKEMGRIITDLKEDREKGDYGVVTPFNKEDAEDAIKKAEIFLENTITFFKEKGIAIP